MASLQKNPNLKIRFRPASILFLLSCFLFFPHLHGPNPKLSDTRFMRLEETLPRYPFLRRRFISRGEPGIRNVSYR